MASVAAQMFRAPVFVVTPRARKTLFREGGTSFTFVTDGVDSAIERGRAAANGKDVTISGGGNLLRQVIRARLLDQLELHISPVLIGNGCACSIPPATTPSNSARRGSSIRLMSPTFATGSTGLRG